MIDFYSENISNIFHPINTTYLLGISAVAQK